MPGVLPVYCSLAIAYCLLPYAFCVKLRLAPLPLSARTAHLATADKSGQPHAIPICFVFDGKHFFSA